MSKFLGGEGQWPEMSLEDERDLLTADLIHRLWSRGFWRDPENPALFRNRSHEVNVEEVIAKTQADRDAAEELVALILTHEALEAEE